LSTAPAAAVNNATGVVPNAVHRPVGRAVDGSGPACHRARRHETPGDQRLSLCKGKAEREPAVTGGLVSHEQGRCVVATSFPHPDSVCGLFPNWVGSDQERWVELAGDRLTLSASPLLLAGKQQVPPSPVLGAGGPAAESRLTAT
jgi:hypothetical protein